MSTAAVKDEFENTAGSTIGVVTINRRGEPHPIAVTAGETIWLSEEEQILTANAPRREEDNVLANGKLRKVSSGHEIANRRPLAPAGETPPTAAVEVPAAPVPPAQTAEVGTKVPTPVAPEEAGVLQPTEEVATPAAATKPKPAAKKPAAN